jgi:hypothetical protein
MVRTDDVRTNADMSNVVETKTVRRKIVQIKKRYKQKLLKRF